MAELVLSLGEKTFILHGIDADLRNDGRRRCEYRSMEIETGLFPHTHGSARLCLGGSDVLASVKLELDNTQADKPSEGKLEFYVDCSANASPEFEGKGGDDLATEISNVLTLAYKSPDAFDLKGLCILPHKKCWKMIVDVLVLQCGGNLFDAVGIVVKAALYNTELPNITAATLDGGDADIQLSDDPYDCVKLDVTNYPLVITLSKVGDNFIVDPSLEEEMCSTSSIVMSVLPNGKVSSIIKIGCGSVQPVTLTKMLKMGQRLALSLNEAVMKALETEAQYGRKKPIFGFLRGE